MTNTRTFLVRASVVALAALVLLGVDLDVDMTLNPVFGLLG